MQCSDDVEGIEDIGLVNLAAGGGVARAVCCLRHTPASKQQQQQTSSLAASLFEHDFAISAISSVNASLTS